ncbi:phosphatidylserine decarboxylase [Citromicrobium bathyomarinum]|jgi:phosphatidylserine decarboxylase|uniref:phosphatidylserine decarboxylase n=1 Tax=Sphingomonadales TaxID=204457 RepID=UPI001A3BD97F|nr:phosphatidylserine decarboxylase [Citromicrobium sp.]|tara:strand:+ start:20161 stop:20898 length:738 start_codon:yes stop_codon:yes gene_type:complete
MAGEVMDNRGRGEARSSLPSVHPEGRKYALICLGLSLIAALLAWETLAWPLAFLSLCILAFFRDPERVVPRGDALILSPADGTVTQISEVEPPLELRGEEGGLGYEPVTRISIYLSIFDVHINRSPCAGTVGTMSYVPGKFVNAELDKSSEENERQHIVILRGDGVAVGMTQIAGLVARRIVPFVKPGDIVAAGQRVGLIRFGSRVDLYLPQGTSPQVLMGQRVIAGETVLGRLGETVELEGLQQ